MTTNRFPANTTNEIILPLSDHRGVKVNFPVDLTLAEWNEVTDLVLSKICRDCHGKKTVSTFSDPHINHIRSPTKPCPSCRPVETASGDPCPQCGEPPEQSCDYYCIHKSICGACGETIDAQPIETEIENDPPLPLATLPTQSSPENVGMQNPLVYVAEVSQGSDLGNVPTGAGDHERPVTGVHPSGK